MGLGSVVMKDTKLSVRPLVDAIVITMPIELSASHSAKVIDRSVVVSVEFGKPMLESVNRWVRLAGLHRDAYKLGPLSGGIDSCHSSTALVNSFVTCG